MPLRIGDRLVGFLDLKLSLVLLTISICNITPFSNMPILCLVWDNCYVISNYNKLMVLNSGWGHRWQLAGSAERTVFFLKPTVL